LTRGTIYIKKTKNKKELIKKELKKEEKKQKQTNKQEGWLGSAIP
jgi:hypothetical protein